LRQRSSASEKTPRREETHEVKAAPFDYVVPDSIEAAVDHLARGAGDATVLAGGQTLMPLLALRMSTPGVLVDINRIKALSGVTRADGGTRVGAITRQAEVLTDGTIAAHSPGVAQAVRFVGHHQTRNRGTVGGSVSLGEPAAELPATAVTLGARIEARSSRGTRLIAAEEFYVGPYSTVRADDEVLAAVHYPAWPQNTRTLFEEVARRQGDFALVGLLGGMVVEGGRIARAGLAWFGMGPTPVPAVAVERALVGTAPADVDVADLTRIALGEVAPGDDLHASEQYRRTVAARVFARRMRTLLAELAA